MLNVLRVALVCLALSLFCGCNFQRDADVTFGDQKFKTAIALIELHKVRFGSYPNSLQELRFTGGWDKMPIGAVQYRKLENGYDLNLVRGWVGKPDLKYPPEFWQGLGLVNSNVKQIQG